MWRNSSSRALLMGKYHGTSAIGNSIVVPKTIKTELHSTCITIFYIAGSYDPADPVPVLDIEPKELHTGTKEMHVHQCPYQH